MQNGKVEQSKCHLYGFFQTFILPQLPGAGCLQFSNGLVLTKEKMQQESMEFTRFFRQIPISYNANSSERGLFYFRSQRARICFEANDNALEWIKDIVQ